MAEAVPERPQRTLKDLAAEACDDVQTACNLIAVVRGMDRALTDLRRLERLDSDALCSHPIVQAWADKIASLTGIQLDDMAASRAHGWCLDHKEG